MVKLLSVSCIEEVSALLVNLKSGFQNTFAGAINLSTFLHKDGSQFNLSSLQ